MNLEQLEGQMAEYEGKTVSVAVPIRGTICQIVCGILKINHDWENHIILYEVRFTPDAAIVFQAQDIHKITSHPSEILAAAITLKSDAPMEKSILDHV